MLFFSSAWVWRPRRMFQGQLCPVPLSSPTSHIFSPLTRSVVTFTHHVAPHAHGMACGLGTTTTHTKPVRGGHWFAVWWLLLVQSVPEGREALALLREKGFIPGGMPWAPQAAELAVEQVCRTGLALELTFPFRAQSFVPRCPFGFSARGISAQASGVSVLQKTWLQRGCGSADGSSAAEDPVGDPCSGCP